VSVESAARPRIVFWAGLGTLVLLYAGWGVYPEAALYREVLTPYVLVALASLIKMATLLTGALVAFACRDQLEPGNPARPAWALLSAGLFSTLVGQMSLAPYQLLGKNTPFPSVGDIYYLLAYPFFIAAFLVVLRAYRESGFPVGSLAERLAILGGVTLVAVVAGVLVLRPVASAGAELLERILNVAYPVLDLVLLLPLSMLLRIALRLRGSHVGAVWAELLAGFVFLCASDALFAYFSALGEQHLDPYVHGAFILSYGLIAGGAHQQLKLLRS
jgi:hypothetical protein